MWATSSRMNTQASRDQVVCMTGTCECTLVDIRVRTRRTGTGRGPVSKERLGSGMSRMAGSQHSPSASGSGSFLGGIGTGHARRTGILAPAARVRSSSPTVDAPGGLEELACRNHQDRGVPE